MKSDRKNPFLIAAITLAGIAFTTTSAFAIPYYWDTDSDTAAGAGGVSPNGNWVASGTTWSTDSLGAAATSAYTTLAADDLFFSAGTDATGSYTVTLGANQDANSLTFEEGAVTLAGNTITLAAGGVTVAPGAGDAIIGSALTASGARTYDVGAGRTLTLNGIVTSTITKTGAGTMTMGAAAHVIAGNHTVNEGLLITNHATNDLLKGNVVINNGGTMRWTGTRWDNGSQFTINAGGTLNIQATSDLVNRITGAGTITGTGGALLLQGGTSNFSGLISGGMGFRLHSDASATVTLSGINTYTGITTIQRGFLSINSIGNAVVGGPGVPSAIGAPTTVANGTIAMGSPGNTGTLNYTGGAAETDRVINLSSTTGGATLGQNGTGLLKFTSPFTATGIGSKTVTLQGSTAGTGEIAGAIVDNPTVGTTVSTAASSASTSLVLGSVDGLTAGNAISGTGIPGSTTIVSFDTATKTVTLSAPATVAAAAVITSTGLVNRTSLVKTGTGTWTLSGNNTYTGTTTGASGTLLLPKTAVLPGYTAPGKVVFNAGTIGALMGDGTTGWTTTEVDTLLSNATKTSGTLGIDTSNGDLTQWTAFAGGVGNFGALGLAKLGTNILTLNVGNTYTGATIIKEGTLKLSSVGLLNSGNYAGAVTFGSAAATFEHAGTGTQTLSGAVTGGGAVILSNNGQLILSNTGNTYGSLSLNSGRVFLNNNITALPTAATVSVTGGGNLVFGPAGARANAITVGTGAGLTARNGATLSNVTLPGSGSVIFNNDDVNTNLLTISTDQTLTGSLTVQVGGTRMLLTGGSIGRVDLSGKLTGSGGLVVASSGNVGNPNYQTGVITLSGPNDYTGDTTVNSGVIAVIGTSIADTGKLVINDPGKVDLTNAETVSTLFFGAVQQPSGTYSASIVPEGATITTASFSGGGTLIVASGPAAGFSTWITGTFNGGATVPALQQGPNADPDKDGISNLVEYAIAGEDPTVPKATIGSFNGILLSFSKRLDASGITYAIQESTDLGIADDWDEVGSYTENTANTISYTLNPGTPPKNFLRLQVVD
jgi:autotransporter-associated beta strand protein